MKKLLFLFSLSIVTLFIDPNISSASEINSSKEILEEVNTITSDLIEQVNNSLSQEEGYQIYQDTTESGVTITLEAGVLPEVFRNRINLLSTGSVKDYSASISYDGAGFNFSHRVEGSFKVTDAKVSNVTKKIIQTGKYYDHSHNSEIGVVDPSVQEVYTTGYFKSNIPILGIFVQKSVQLDVGLYGSGNYRVITAQVN